MLTKAKGTMNNNNKKGNLQALKQHDDLKGKRKNLNLKVPKENEIYSRVLNKQNVHKYILF